MKRLLFLMIALLAVVTARSQAVTYLDASGTQQTLADGTYTVVTDQTAWTSGWYVVNADVTIANRITATGDVHLVLMDGVTFTASKGITVTYNAEANNALTIYAQSNATGMGKLVVDNVSYGYASIGGEKSKSCGVITINGGDLDIKSGDDGAAIGSGNNVYNNNYGVVIVNGGTLMLHPCGYGAGIGGGEYSANGTITINGGNITAYGGTYSAGIGGCDGYDGGIITITGGTIYAQGGGKSPGIGGGGYWGSSSGNGGRSGTITITGGQIAAIASGGAAAIGASLTPKTPKETDVIRLSWTSSTDRYETQNGGYNAFKVFMDKPFNIESTGNRATLEDLASPNVIVPLDGQTLHSVTYKVDGEVYEQYNVVEGEQASNLPYYPSDKLFDAWYQEGASEPWNFELPVMEDLVLEAQYKNVVLDTDASGAYLIGTADEWNAFAVLVNNGDTNINAKLTGNVTGIVDYYMVGTESDKYAGTFDGQGYTLTVEYESYEVGIGPFHYVSNATIQNLTVAGTLNPQAKYCGGIVGKSYGVTITDCVSSVTINSDASGDVCAGGLIGYNYDNTATLTNCIFDGKFIGVNSRSWGGLIWNTDTRANLNHCFFVPEELNVTTNYCRTFLGGGNANYNECYYSRQLGTAQGIFMAQIIPGNGVTINGTPTLTHKGVEYYGDGSTIDLNYALPQGKEFYQYTVSSGTISNKFNMTGEHVVSGFTGDVTIDGNYVDSKIDISSGTIAAIDDETYDKTEHEPDLNVTVGDQELVKVENYTVQWSNNVDAGIATVTVSGCGLYTGELTATFNILPRNINDEVITTSCYTRFVPTGEVIHPEPTLTYGVDKLIAGTDYEVSYTGDRIEVGDYSLSVTGKGNYTGSIVIPFSIIGAVTYLDYADGSFTEATCETYQMLNDQTTLTSGWYVVGNVTTIADRITATGDVHIILMDGAKLTASKGITVNYGSGSYNNKLTIYAQSDVDGMGKLVVDNVEYSYAGIGGRGSYSCGIITINGGDLDIKSGNNGAAIGSGSNVNNNNYGVVVVNGGTLMLRPYSYGAGIGGGEYSAGGTITINGGNITAVGGSHSAGIGGCDGYDGGIITINGGIINATGGGSCPGIGGGEYWSSSTPGGQSGTITINGGQITATPGSGGTTAIGASYNPKTAGENDKITLSWTNADDFITANGNYVSGSVTFAKAFKLKDTNTIATLDNIANATIVPASSMFTLAEALELPDGTPVEVTNELIVVALVGNHAYATDANNNWIRLDLDDASQLATGMKIANVSGTLANVATAPTLSNASCTATGVTVEVTNFIADISMTQTIARPVPNSVAKVTGYYFGGELRAYSTNHGQSITIANDFADVDFEEGKPYTILMALELKETWDAGSAPLRAVGDYDFQNIKGRVISARDMSTGFDDIRIVGGKEVRYYDINGRYVGNNLKDLPAGLYFGSDGVKVRK